MSDAVKKELHDLVDTLPVNELNTARRFLEYLRDEGTDPYAHLDFDDEMDDESRAELDASLKRGLEQASAGKSRPVEELLARLRARE